MLYFGCTHYPLVQEEIKNVLGNVQFFNGAPNLAKHLKEVLKEKDLLNDDINEYKIEFEDSQKLIEKEQRFFYILKGEKINEDIKK